MSEENCCPRCGTLLPGHIPLGLCPVCLLKRGLDSALPAQEPFQAGGDFTPPTPAQLADSFPDLEILEFIGRGGMGMVYKARQRHLNRLVALKILMPGIARDPAFAERFAREARAMAILSHPHIVVVHDFGETTSPRPPGEGNVEGGACLPSPATMGTWCPARGAGGEGGMREGGLYYFLMEFVDGLTLRQLLNAGKLAPQEALAIVPQICEALQYAHDKGVVHRDIKPENILMDRSGQVKIADFGLAKLMGQEAKDFSITSVGQVMGTPYYMAPEQTERPQDVDHRADIYALGVVFYQMLTGELPIGRFAPPSKKVQIDVRLDEVVLRALEKEPELRYQQASEVKTQVEAITATPGTVPPSSRQVMNLAPGSPAETAAGGENGMPRFSRAAVVGAAWSPWFIMALLAFFIRVPARVPAGSTPPGPEWWQWILIFTILPLGLLAPFGTTILGAVAMARIRRSAGRLYGLGLALFDILLFPLLALDILVWAVLVAIGRALVLEMSWSVGRSDLLFFVFVATVFLAGLLDIIIVRWVWRAANKPLNASPPASSVSVASPSHPSAPAADDEAQQQARQLVQGPAIGLLITGMLNWLVVPVIVIVMAYKMLGFASGPTIFVVPLIAALFASLVFSSFVIFAALKMRQLEAYGLAIAASILVIFISPSNLIGLPIGIWSLVVLSRPAVGKAFELSRRAQCKRRAATGFERKMGIAALVLFFVAPLPGIISFSLLGRIWLAVIALILLIELGVLMLGILGRRGLAGRIALVFLGLQMLGFMVQGPTLVANFAQIYRDFGGWPDMERLGSNAEKEETFLRQPAAAATREAMSFGAVIERALSANDALNNAFLNFETGEVKSAPKAFRGSLVATSRIDAVSLQAEANVLDWMKANQVDVMASTGAAGRPAMLLHSLPVAGIVDGPGRDTFNSLTAEYTLQEMRSAEKALGGSTNFKKWFQSPQPVYAFTTHKGQIGLIEIVASKPDRVTFRYKLVQSAMEQPVAQPAPGAMSFSSVIERVVRDPISGDESLIDLDTGTLGRLEGDVYQKFADRHHDQKVLQEWYARKGIDAQGCYEKADPPGPVADAAKKALAKVAAATGIGLPSGTMIGLITFDMSAVKVSDEQWDSTTPNDVLHRLAAVRPRPLDFMVKEADQPATWLFRTRKGGRGILQVLGGVERPFRSVRIRYKLVQQPDQARNTGDTRNQADAPVTMTASGDEKVQMSSLTAASGAEPAPPSSGRLATEQRLRQRLTIEHQMKQKVWTWQRLQQEIEKHLKTANTRFVRLSVDVSPDLSAAAVTITGLQEMQEFGGEKDWVDIDASLTVRNTGSGNWTVQGTGQLAHVQFTVAIPDLMGADAGAPVKGFGPVIERIITEYDADRNGLVFFRMDTGVSFPPDSVPVLEFPGTIPFAQITPELQKWIKTTGADLLFRLTNKDFKYMNLDMQKELVGTSEDWGKIKPAQLTAVFAMNGADRDHSKDGGMAFGGYSTVLAPCLAFRTRKGLIGVYQVEGIPDVAQHPGVLIRYKLVQGDSSGQQDIPIRQQKAAAEIRK